MNNGLLIGFTKRSSNVQAGDAFPQLNVRYDNRTAFTLTQSDVNFLICTTNGSAVTITVPRLSLRSGECIHIKQDGAGQVTFSPSSDVTIDVASTVSKTRTQNSVVTLMKEDDMLQANQVWALFGDFASS